MWPNLGWIFFFLSLTVRGAMDPFLSQMIARDDMKMSFWSKRPRDMKKKSATKHMARSEKIMYSFLFWTGISFYRIFFLLHEGIMDLDPNCQTLGVN